MGVGMRSHLFFWGEGTEQRDAGMAVPRSEREKRTSIKVDRYTNICAVPDLQVLGFAMLGILFIICYADYSHLSAGGIRWFQFLYFFSTLWGQFGPNATTWLVPAEVAPTEMRSMCHGFAAAVGKSGEWMSLSAGGGVYGALQMWLEFITAFLCRCSGSWGRLWSGRKRHPVLDICHLRLCRCVCLRANYRMRRAPTGAAAVALAPMPFGTGKNEICIDLPTSLMRMHAPAFNFPLQAWWPL